VGEEAEDLSQIPSGCTRDSFLSLLESLSPFEACLVPTEVGIFPSVGCHVENSDSHIFLSWEDVFAYDIHGQLADQNHNEKAKSNASLRQSSQVSPLPIPVLTVSYHKSNPPKPGCPKMVITPRPEGNSRRASQSTSSVKFTILVLSHPVGTGSLESRWAQ
jgi:hypothetical protein